MSKNPTFTVELEQEVDGRWIADVQELPGAMVYGKTRNEALAKAEALALRVVAEQLETGEKVLPPATVVFSVA